MQHSKCFFQLLSFFVFLNLPVVFFTLFLLELINWSLPPPHRMLSLRDHYGRERLLYMSQRSTVLSSLLCLKKILALTHSCLTQWNFSSPLPFVLPDTHQYSHPNSTTLTMAYPSLGSIFISLVLSLIFLPSGSNTTFSCVQEGKHACVHEGVYVYVCVHIKGQTDVCVTVLPSHAPHYLLRQRSVTEPAIPGCYVVGDGN